MITVVLKVDDRQNVRLCSTKLLLVCSQKGKLKGLKSSSSVDSAEDRNAGSVPVVHGVTNLSSCKLFCLVIADLVEICSMF